MKNIAEKRSVQDINLIDRFTETDYTMSTKISIIKIKLL